MSDDIKRIPIKDLVSEEGAHELATSADMEPYLEYLKARDSRPRYRFAVERHRCIAARKALVWRIASSLKWAFADFDDVTVGIDELTLTPEDFTKVAELLKFRPVQFCLFLKALFGAEAMEQMIGEAVAMAIANQG